MSTATVYVCNECGNTQDNDGKCIKCGAETHAEKADILEK